ncbi:MAG: hypothetical protein D6768_16070 [Chloroflexi bacterium]|nr:MAG: hypothetical protein D6768_16070 [Chloroflexota bacterium]
MIEMAIIMKPHRFQKYLTDRNISLIIRWWAAGAVYFFIGWGTNLGRQESIIDFVVSLGLVMGLFNIIIINPGLRMMFNIAPKRPAHENTYWQRISDYLVELLKNILIMLIVALIYIALNSILVSLFALPSQSVPLPGEPILFGAFYVFVFVLLALISEKTKKAIRNSRDKNVE